MSPSIIQNQHHNSRELATLTENGVTWTNTYNADGLRISRTNGTLTYKYYYADGQLVRIGVGSKYLDISYDASGVPMALYYSTCAETLEEGTVEPRIAQKIGEVKASLTSKGWTVSGAETRIPVGGGKYRYPDIIATKNGMTRFYQIGRQTMAGKPVARELRALRDLGRTAADVFFIAYNYRKITMRIHLWQRQFMRISIRMIWQNC